jgi:TatA/E family protein of Tat protein translocase
MGLSGVSFGELLIVLAIVLLIFGSGRLARAGSDLGTAIRGFRKAMSEETPASDSRGAPGGPGEAAAGSAALEGGATTQATVALPRADPVPRP